MNAGIAQVTAEKGYRVLLKDKDLAGVARGQGYIKDNLQVWRDDVYVLDRSSVRQCP